MSSVTYLRSTATPLDLEQLAESWQISLRADHKSPHTVRGYVNAVRSYLREGYEDLGKLHVQAWIAGIPQSGTANFYARAIRQFSRWLLAEGEIDVDTLADLKAPSVKEKMVAKVSDEDVRKLLKACSGPSIRDIRDAALIALGYSTGLRAAEVLALRVEDVDMRRQTAVVISGKGGRGRIVMFSNTAARYLDKYLRARRKHPRADSEWLWVGGDPVSVGQGKLSSHLSYNGMAASLRRRAQIAGIEGFHYHRLRHTAASNWLMAGGSEGGLMAMAGWKNHKMLARYTLDTQQERALAEAKRLGIGNI